MDLRGETRVLPLYHGLRGRGRLGHHGAVSLLYPGSRGCHLPLGNVGRAEENVTVWSHGLDHVHALGHKDAVGVDCSGGLLDRFRLHRTLLRPLNFFIIKYVGKRLLE